jgi:FAD-linked oxidoreductase
MSTHWRNWSGSASCQPARFEKPDDTAAVQALIRQCRSAGQRLRVSGAAHSFTPLVPTDETLVSLEKLSGLDAVSEDRKTATVWAGTNLRTLGKLLHAEGLGQENLGDIDAQAIAGALSTGTHGTGAAFGTLSTQIEGMEIVDGNGQVRWLDRQNSPEIFSAARIALGSFGLITRLKLRTDPAYRLEFVTGKESLDNVLINYPKYLSRHRNYEFYWFPYSGMVQNKFSDKTEKPAKPQKAVSYLTDIVLENYVFKLLSEVARMFPATCESISQLSAQAVSTSRKVNWSHQVYATARLVRFQEMEYNLPREAFPEVVRQMEARMAKERFRVHFPIECRFVAADDIPLSPAYGRESAYIAVHMYQGMPYQEFFQAMEEIFLAYEGRPHWGKMHTLNAQELSRRYPRWEQFQAIRQQMDPDGIFLNPYLENLFGLQKATAQRPGLRVQV